MSKPLFVTVRTPRAVVELAIGEEGLLREEEERIDLFADERKHLLALNARNMFVHLRDNKLGRTGQYYGFVETFFALRGYRLEDGGMAFGAVVRFVNRRLYDVFLAKDRDEFDELRMMGWCGLRRPDSLDDWIERDKKLVGESV